MSHVNLKKKQCLVELKKLQCLMSLSVSIKSPWPMSLSPKMALWGLTDKTKGGGGAGGVNT